MQGLSNALKKAQDLLKNTVGWIIPLEWLAQPRLWKMLAAPLMVVAPITPIHPVPSWFCTVVVEPAPRFSVATEELMSDPLPLMVTEAEGETMKALLICAALL